MPRRQRMNRTHADQIQRAIKQLQEADVPAGQQDARELLAVIHDALKDLEVPLVELIRKGNVPHPDGDEQETPATAQRHLRQLRNDIRHALREG